MDEKNSIMFFLLNMEDDMENIDDQRTYEKEKTRKSWAYSDITAQI